jgi:hypothetical protein
MSFYEKIPTKVEAYQWFGPVVSSTKFPVTFDPVINQHSWGENITYSLETPKGNIPLEYGDYILRNYEGEYERVRAPAFKRQYRQVIVQN